MNIARLAIHMNISFCTSFTIPRLRKKIWIFPHIRLKFSYNITFVRCWVKLSAKRQTRATNEWRQIHSSETVKRRSHMPICVYCISRYVSCCNCSYKSHIPDLIFDIKSRMFLFRYWQGILLSFFFVIMQLNAWRFLIL